MLTRLTWVVGLIVTATVLLFYAAEPRALSQMRASIQDVYQRAAPRVADPETPVHLIDIDEASLRELGQWPWPRTYMAELTDRLFDMGAAAVGFDVLFAEPDRTSPTALIRTWGLEGAGDASTVDALRRIPDHDRRFAQALSAGPTVLAISGAPDGAAPEMRSGLAYTGRLPAQQLTRFPGALSPIPELADAVSGFGGISLVPGSDGITRSVPMLAIYGDTLVPSLSAELLRVAQGAGSHILITSEASGQVSGGANVPVAMRTGAVDYPLDENGHFRIHFSDPLPSRTTSAAMILAEDADLVALSPRVAGKIVLIGSSAQALFDIRTTPLSPEMPGMELHAMILEQILTGSFLIRPDWMRGVEVLMIVLTGTMVTFLAARERPVLGLAGALGALTLLLGAGWIGFSRYGVLINALEPAVTALAVYLPTTTINVFGKERARRKIRDRFGYFLPSEIVDEIAADPESRLTPTGAARELSVMFVDMRQFTTLTERMDPSDVVHLLNVYLGAASEALVASGATIDKFMGDAVMAFWNAPLPQADHGQRAIRAAFAVEAAVAAANGQLLAEGLPEVEARIGINTGPAFVGLMGSAERLNYSCVGDSVTLAARFETETRTYGVRNLIGEETARDVPEEYIAIPIDRVAVKGRRGAVTVSTVLPRSEAATALAERMHALREAYLAGDWAMARARTEEVARIDLDGVDTGHLARLYRDRITQLDGTAPPPDWDGTLDRRSGVRN